MKKKKDQESMFDFEKIGKKIEKLRASKQYTQADLAYKIDVTTNYISLIENGKSKGSLELFYKLSKEFGITINELLDEDEITIEYHRRKFFDKANKYEVNLVDALIDTIEKNRKLFHE